MSQNIPLHFVNQFSANVAQLVQQKNTRFRRAVREEKLEGEKSFYDQIGVTTPVERTSRHADTPLIDTPVARRMVTSRTYDWADLIDKPDRIKLLQDPQSIYARNASAAFARKIDDVIINAFFADAYTGKDGSTTTSFPAGNQVAVNFDGSANDLTYTKMLEAKRLLLASDVDPDEEMYIAISPRQMVNLLKVTEVKSADYNTVRALAAGQIDSYMGFKFIMTNRLLTDASTYLRIPCWAKSGMLLGVGYDVMTSADKRPDKNNSIQIWASMNLGATRMEEAKVIEIKCNNS